MPLDIPVYTDMNKSQLEELLECRGLPTGGVKTYMIARLLKQDAAELFAQQATARAVQAHSTESPGGTRGATVENQLGMSHGGGRDADRVRVSKKWEAMRRERLEKDKAKNKAQVKTKGTKVEDAVGKEVEHQDEAEMDPEALVRELMELGVMRSPVEAGRASAPYLAAANDTFNVNSSGISFSLTVQTAHAVRRGAAVPHHKLPTFTFPNHAKRPAGFVQDPYFDVPAGIPGSSASSDRKSTANKSALRESDSGMASKLPGDTPPSRKSPVDKTYLNDAGTAFIVFGIALIIATVFIFVLRPDCVDEVAGYIKDFLKDPIGFVRQGIWDPDIHA